MTDRNDMPEKTHCACKFSSGDVLSKSCEFHRRMIAAERERCATVCERMRPHGGRAWSEGQAACHEALSVAAAHIRAGLG